MLTNEDAGPVGIDDALETNELIEYWNILFGRRRIILALGGVVFLISGIYFSILPNIYTGEAQILAEKVDQRPTSFQEMAMPAFAGEEDYYGTQVAILTGRKIQEVVRLELHLDENHKFKVKAKRLRGTRIILLSVKEKDPQLAAAIANKFSEVYMRENMQNSLFMPKQLLKWLPGESELSGKEGAQESLKGTSEREQAESLKSVTSDPIVQKLKSDKVDVEAQLRELSQRYKSQHPVVKELNERLVYLDAQIVDRRRQIIGSLRANLAGEFQITNVRILEEALPPNKPSEPRRFFGIFIATLFGFFLACFFVLFMEFTNQKIRTEEDCSRGLNVPFLGNVPLVKELMNDKSSKNGDTPNLLTGNASLVDVFKRNGELSDALAVLRTRLLFSMPFEKSKRIMVTSSIPAEGKSTLCALLALSLANIGERVLLISSDIRRPYLAKYLGVRYEKGLTDFLVGTVSSLEDIVCDVPGSSIKLITSGNNSPNPTELLESKRFQDLLDRVSQNFDRVIIDVTPVLFIPDGVIIAKHVHSRILTCGAGMVHKRVVRNVVKKFEELKHSFSGIVINRAIYGQGAYSYHYKYYKAYKSYYKKEEAITK